MASQMEIIEAFAREGSSSNNDAEISAVDTLISQCPFNSIFELVSKAEPNSEKEEILLLAISRIFHSSHSFHYLTSNEDYFIQALNSGTRKKIRECFSKILFKLSHSVNGAMKIISSNKLRQCLLDSISNENDIELYEHSSKTLISSLKSSLSLNYGKQLFEEILVKVKEYENNSIVLMRYIELIVQLSICGTDLLFNVAIDCNALDVLLEVIKKSGKDI